MSDDAAVPGGGAAHLSAHRHLPAEVTKVDGPRQWLRFDRDAVTASELLTRVTAQAEVRDLSVEEPDIESIVREIYGA